MKERKSVTTPLYRDVFMSVFSSQTGLSSQRDKLVLVKPILYFHFLIDEILYTFCLWNDYTLGCLYLFNSSKAGKHSSSDGYAVLREQHLSNFIQLWKALVKAVENGNCRDHLNCFGSPVSVAIAVQEAVKRKVPEREMFPREMHVVILICDDSIFPRGGSDPFPEGQCDSRLFVLQYILCACSFSLLLFLSDVTQLYGIVVKVIP